MLCLDTSDLPQEHPLNSAAGKIIKRLAPFISFFFRPEAFSSKSKCLHCFPTILVSGSCGMVAVA